MYNLHRMLFCTALVAVLSLCGICDDFYLDTTAIATGASITVNGFPVLSSVDEGARSLSSVITPFLVDGRNRIEMSYIPMATNTQNSMLEWKLFTLPDKQPRSLENEKPVTEKRVGSREINLSQLKPDEVTPLVGSLTNDRLVFAPSATGIHWACRLAPEQHFQRLPSQLRYIGLTRDLKAVKVHFLRYGYPAHVVFAGLMFPSGTNTVDLKREAIISGLQWADSDWFDEVYIESETADTKEKTGIGFLKFYEIQGSLRDSEERQIKQPQHWAWQDGAVLTDISTEQENALWDAVARFHDALAKGDTTVLKELLGTKVDTLVKVVHQTKAQLEQGMDGFYSDLAKRPDWKLNPIDRAQLRYYRINDRVVRVETLAGEEPVISAPVTLDANRKDIFKVPLYYAYLKGKWVVVW